MKHLLPLLLIAVAGPACARDGRIATHLYDPARIVTVNGHTGIQSTIEFAPDEHIENVAVGDSATWQVTPNKRASLLFVKPMMAPSRTNMTVVTSERTYLFDLIATRGDVPLYVLRFTYPPSPKPATPPVVATIVPPALPTEAPAPAPTPADLNFAWVTAGAKQLLPARTFDDGKSTWLSWPKDAAMPAILTREPNGDEGPVNYTVQGDYVVVDGVPGQLVLRQGKLMATLTPAPHAIHAPPPVAVTPTPGPASSAAPLPALAQAGSLPR